MTLDIMDGDLWQWDTGREVEAVGCEQVHFAKSTAGTCYTVEVAGGKAKIPDELLQAAGRVRGETEGGRKSAETGRDTAEKERVEAEAKREQGWTDLKAEAEKSVSDAVERADAASKAATKAVADVKATEAKLYPVAENVLKDTAKDTLIHVDDAFPSSLLGIEIEGACKQDGTPSPDNPVPIQVVENPVFKVTGRNLLDFSFPAYYAAYSSDIAYIKYSYKEVALPFTTGINSANGFGFALKLKPGTYTLRTSNAPAKASAAIAMYAKE